MTHKRPAVFAAVTLAILLAVSGCSATATPSASNSSAALSPSAQKAAAVVKAAMAPNDTFESPGPAIKDVKSLSGKVVYYVAIAIQVPLFKRIADSLTEALKPAGIEVKVCDAQGNPGGVASCLGQAVDAHADAVIAGGFPEVLAPVAFKSVRDAGIPLLFTTTTPVKSDDPKVSYISPDYFKLQSTNASWIIADSDAKANVLVVESTDNPDLIAWVEQGALKTYKSECPNCKVKVVTTTAAQADKLSSLVTSALVADSTINYIQVAFDDHLQATLQGVQATGRSDVKVVSEDGSLSALQSLAKGTLVVADTGFDSRAFSWYVADRTLRLLGGQATENYTYPRSRLFTKATASKLNLTPADEASGAWYGKADYQSAFKKLWGIN